MQTIFNDITKMKLPRYIKIKPFDDQFPAIVQTEGAYVIGAIMPNLNGSLDRTAHKAKIYNYNLYVVFAGFFAPSTERADIGKVLNEMAEYAYNEIVHPSFYGYKKNCENVEEELRLLKGEKAEKREAKKQEKFERVAQAIFKK